MLTNFSELFSSSVRSDDYVNATELCKAFNYKLDNWKSSTETLARKRVYEKDPKNQALKFWIIEGKGRGSKTWLHPIAAIHLAQYLSPEFANYVAETFKRYLEGDISLASEIVDRTEDLKGVEELSDRVQLKRNYLKSYHGVHGELKDRGCIDIHHAVYNKRINKAIGILDGKRSQMTREQELLMSAAQALGEVALIRNPAVKEWGAVKIATDVTKTLPLS